MRVPVPPATINAYLENCGFSHRLLQNQHGIAIAEKAVFFLHSLIIALHHEVIAHEGCDHHHQSRLGPVKIREHCIGNVEFVRGVDEAIGPTFFGA